MTATLTVWDQALEATETSQTFQYNTGWDVAADLHDGDDQMTVVDCIQLTRAALAARGEAEPTDNEMLGMVGYFNGYPRQ